VLKPGGSYVFLTPNFWDYGSLIAHLVPNRMHPWIVHRVEGRQEEDVFATCYQANTKHQIGKLAARAGLAVERFDYLGQYPNYLKFNRKIFELGCRYAKFLQRTPPLHWLQGWIMCELRAR
jgi:hypothetical protein